MANKSRFVIAQQKIKSFFLNGTKNVYTRSQLNIVFNDNRALWDLASSMTFDKFIKNIIEKNILRQEIISFQGYVDDKEIFLNDNARIFEIASSIFNKSYLSHYTAVYLNGLTTQVPKTIYVTFEQSRKEVEKINIEQKAIDAAFSKPQRKSEAFAIYNDYTIFIHNGKYSNRLGVYALDNAMVTNIERTLIDIVVRPNYAGGIHSVLETYINAKDKISINKLVATLEKMDFIYPYHQSIGFLLERAGYTNLDDLRKKEMDYDFYLTYDIQDKEYSKDWKLYYPKNL
jgi:predicted transcriptional regulator of viral defense system